MKGTTLRLVEAEDFSEENDDKRQPWDSKEASQ
jgi:hypothetical protein